MTIRLLCTQLRNILKLLYERGYFLSATTGKPLSDNKELNDKAIDEAVNELYTLINKL